RCNGCLVESIPRTQDPLHLQQHRNGHEQLFALQQGRTQQVFDHRALRSVIVGQPADQDIRIQGRHQPWSMRMSSIETRVPGDGLSRPFRSITDLVLARNTTVPSGMGVKVTLSCGFNPKARRTSTGMVTCPLLVMVASDTRPLLTIIEIVRQETPEVKTG